MLFDRRNLLRCQVRLLQLLEALLNIVTKLIEQKLAFLLNLLLHRIELLLSLAFGLSELRHERFACVAWRLRDRIKLAQARRWGLHGAGSRDLAARAVIDELNVRVSPDRLSVLDGETSSFLGALNVLELDRRRLLLEVAVDADHFAEIAEESVDLNIRELLRRYVLDVNGVSARIIDHAGLLGRLNGAASLHAASGCAHATGSLRRAHRHVRGLLLVKV